MRTSVRRRCEPDSAENSRFRLDPVSYENLRQRVLRRDCWRCQECGSMANLEVYHLKFAVTWGMSLSLTSSGCVRRAILGCIGDLLGILRLIRHPLIHSSVNV